MRIIFVLLYTTVICLSSVLACRMISDHAEHRRVRASQFSIDAVSRVDGSFRVHQNKILNTCKGDKHCRKMAEAIYFEARGEGYKGMVAVGNVIMNRVKSPYFKDTIHEVVHRPYQFSYVREVKNKKIKEPPAYRTALFVAYRVINGLEKDITKGATHYVAKKRLKRIPRWMKEYEKTVAINEHTFYRR